MKSLMDTSLVPFDITLEIKYSGKKVQAHKCILGMASPVFSNIFFGESKETKDVILVEEARDGAFSSVINYIYGNGITWAGEDDIKDMFAIVDVAERYEIKALMVEAKEKIENVSVREDNVVQVGAAALEFMYLSVLSNALFYNCVGFLQTRLTKSEDFVSFASKYCDTKYCKAALKLVASFSAAELSNSWSGCESDSISPLKISGIISLADEKDQNLVTSEDPQVKQELLPSPPQTLEISITVCKEEQKQDCVPEGESKEYFEVDKQEQDDWYSGSCTISCEVGLSAPSESVPPVESAPPSNVDPQARQEQKRKCSDSDSDIGSSCRASSEVDISDLSESACVPLESAPHPSNVDPQASLVLLVTDHPTPCPEMVGGRKPGLIFTEVWQIPVMEMGSEGSFANHWGKALLLDVLDSIPDVSTLVDISDQIRNKEEFKSLQESDRQEIVAETSTFLNTALRAIREKINIEEERENPVVTLQVYKLHQKLDKMWPGKEKDVFIFLRDMYAVIKDKAVGKVEMFQKKSEVLSFWSAMLRFQANSVPNTITGTAGQDDVTASRASNEVVGEEGDKNVANLDNWQHWGKILADQEKMGQFKSMLAMSSALPNMTPVDMAALCGLGQSDMDGLAVYTTNISSLSPSALASMGITSSQLSFLAHIASLTGANSQFISAKAKKQAEFEQKNALLEPKHCYVCVEEFDSRYKFREHCKNMKDFEKDHTENITRLKKMKYRKKMFKDAKDVNDNKKRNAILMKKDVNGKKIKVKKHASDKVYDANVRNEARASSPFYPQKHDKSKQNALVKTPTRKMVVFYCPHCEEGFRTKEKKETHARKMTCYFNSGISFKPGSLLSLL